jgi:hypothetical protein
MLLKHTIFFCGVLSAFTISAQPTVQPFDMEVTAPMLEWKSVEKNSQKIYNSRIYLSWKREFSEERAVYSELDIDGDGKKEIIIAGDGFPSRGRGYLILKKVKGTFVNINQFRGGFIFYRENKSIKKYDLHIFEKWDGDMYYYVQKISNGQFKLKSTTLLPRTLYDGEFYEKWVELNYIEKFHVRH